MFFFLLVNLMPSSAVWKVDVPAGQISFGAATTVDVQELPKTVPELDAWMQTSEKVARLSLFERMTLRQIGKSLNNPAGLGQELLDTISKAMVAVVPVHAWILLLLYRRPKFLYAQHLVFSLHVHAFAYVVFALSVTMDLVAHGRYEGIALAIAAAVTAIYVVVAHCRAYGQTLLRSLWKAAVTAVGYFGALVFVIMAALAVALFRL